MKLKFTIEKMSKNIRVEDAETGEEVKIDGMLDLECKVDNKFPVLTIRLASFEFHASGPLEVRRPKESKVEDSEPKPPKVGVGIAEYARIDEVYKPVQSWAFEVNGQDPNTAYEPNQMWQDALEVLFPNASPLTELLESLNGLSVFNCWIERDEPLRFFTFKLLGGESNPLEVQE